VVFTEYKILSHNLVGSLLSCLTQGSFFTLIWGQSAHRAVPFFVVFCLEFYYLWRKIRL